MCFSAEASFGASIVLAVVGTIAVRKVDVRSQLPFAFIPFIFAFQQFSEGILWLSFHHEDLFFLRTISTYTFLIFAQIVWPTWVPISILLLEKEANRKKMLYITLGCGILLSSYLAYCYLFYDVKAEVSNHHIQYDLHFPHTAHYLWLTGLFYFIPTVISTIISSVPRMRILGLIILLSCLLTRMFTLNYFISIWCFFAAIISVMVAFIMSGLHKSTRWTEWFSKLRS